jgi:hypothetical protein
VKEFAVSRRQSRRALDKDEDDDAVERVADEERVAQLGEPDGSVGST